MPKASAAVGVSLQAVLKKAHPSIRTCSLPGHHSASPRRVLTSPKSWQVPCVPRCWNTCFVGSAIQLPYVTLPHALRSLTPSLLFHCRLLIPLRCSFWMRFSQCRDPFAGTLECIPTMFSKLFDGWSKQLRWKVGRTCVTASLLPLLGVLCPPKRNLFRCLLHFFYGLKLA